MPTARDPQRPDPAARGRVPRSPAKTLPFKRESPLVDAAFSTRRSEVHICTGPLDNEVYATVDLTISDDLIPLPHQLKSKADTYPVNVYWTMERHRRLDGKNGQGINDHPYPHTDITFASDEIEAFATALYQAVQLAKTRAIWHD